MPLQFIHALALDTETRLLLIAFADGQMDVFYDTYRVEMDMTNFVGWIEWL